MHKNKSKTKPSRNYTYGAYAPTVNAERVRDQMRLAHHYRNQLCELEIERRRRVDACLRSLFPEFIRLSAEEERLKAELDAARQAIKDANKSARRRAGTPDQRDAVKQIRQEWKDAISRLKAVKAESFGSERWVNSQNAINAWVKDTRHALHRTPGLYWGNYLRVDQACQGFSKGPPPRFMRWTGEGTLTVQLQTQGDVPKMPVPMLPNEDNTLARVEGYDPFCEKKQRCKLWLRIGTDERKQPVWAVIPFVMHRPLPTDAVVKWVHVHVRKVATHEEWSVRFVLSKDEWVRPDESEVGMVGIDVGWRLLGDGSLRVASWVATDGEKGELVIPAEGVSRWHKADSLQAIRDGMLNTIMEVAGEVRRLAATSEGEWLREDAKTLHLWKSEARLAGLVLRWRERRITGDDAVYGRLESWRKQDKHLFEWEANQRRKAQEWRDHLYRNFVAWLRRKYRLAVIEDLKVKSLGENPKPESEDVVMQAARYHQRIASCGRLMEVIREGFAGHVRVEAAGTTVVCNICGSDESGKFDAKVCLEHTCSVCGTTWDQDENAARNILRRGLDASGDVVDETTGAARGLEEDAA